MDTLKAVGAAGSNDVFVMPHMRALHAVDKGLLQFISDHLVQGAGNFSSAVKVWMGTPEPVPEKLGGRSRFHIVEAYYPEVG